jgi:DNA polymerase III subunit epsilon
MLHKPFVFIDIETTGMSSRDSRILEIGAIRVENGQRIGQFNHILSPQQTVPKFITNLTGITQDMTNNMPSFADVSTELKDFMDGAIFIAHNVSFDYGFIKSEYRMLGQTFNMDRLCTVRLSRRLYPHQTRHNLDTIITEHNISVPSRHRALDDAQVLFDFFTIALQTHGLKAYAEMNKLIKKAKI